MQERQEREYPLRKGSVIRTEEGILFSRCSPGSIPLSTDPEVEYNEILDAYGDSLDEAARLREALISLPDKIMNPESFADDDLTFPLDDPSIEEQNEWFDRFYSKLDQHVRGLVDDVISEALSSLVDDTGIQKARDYYLDLRDKGRVHDPHRQQLIGAIRMARLLGVKLSDLDPTPSIDTDNKTKTPATGTEEEK